MKDGQAHSATMQPELATTVAQAKASLELASAQAQAAPDQAEAGAVTVSILSQAHFAIVSTYGLASAVTANPFGQTIFEAPSNDIPNAATTPQILTHPYCNYVPARCTTVESRHADSACRPRVESRNTDIADEVDTSEVEN